MKIAGAIAIVILVHVLFGEQGLPALLQSKRDAARIEADISSLRAANAALTRQIDGLRNDPAAIEAVARETLGLARPGEVVVVRGR